MFENLSQKLQRILKHLKGEGKLTAQNIEEAMKAMRMALLEADVNYKVVKLFTEKLQAKALGEKVLESLNPAQQVVKIVRDELIETLGGETSEIKFTSKPPTIIMLVGLQGAGKTTSSGKLATWLRKKGRRPMLVSVDVYRPAAKEQIRAISEAVNANLYEGTTEESPLSLCNNAIREAQNSASDVLIIDTAGRLHIDEELMAELREINEVVQPNEILFVVDSMLGQDAVRSAELFNQQLGIDGFILTKLDGDARGGVALSIKSVTGMPIKFIGTGEKYDALEIFHPDRMASRILGMGDVLSLIEKAEQVVDQKKAVEIQKKVISNKFTLEDFRDQINQINKIGSIEQILGMLPKVGPLKNSGNLQIDEKELVRTSAIIDSMTPKERRSHQVINGSRRKRIAKGSGTSVQQVNQLLKQFIQSQKMMKGLTGLALKKGKKGKKSKGTRGLGSRHKHF